MPVRLEEAFRASSHGHGRVSRHQKKENEKLARNIDEVRGRGSKRVRATEERGQKRGEPSVSSALAQLKRSRLPSTAISQAFSSLFADRWLKCWGRASCCPSGRGSSQNSVEICGDASGSATSCPGGAAQRPNLSGKLDQTRRQIHADASGSARELQGGSTQLLAQPDDSGSERGRDVGLINWVERST